jgi:hypothetical protein
MPVTLINHQKRMRVFNLDHPSFDREATQIVVNVIEEARDGGRYPRRVRKRVCGSITLRAKEKRHNLPDQIIKVPQIEQAIKDGTLSYLVVRESAEKPMATATTETKRRSRKRSS